jgi:hypothetical protein
VCYHALPVIRSPDPGNVDREVILNPLAVARLHLKFIAAKNKSGRRRGVERRPLCSLQSSPDNRFRTINSSYLPLVLPLVPVEPLLSLPVFGEPVELSSDRFGIVVKPESPETLPFVPPFSLELIEGDGVLPDWPSERVVSFERQTCVGPLGEYSAALPGAGAGAGGMGAGCVFGLGAIIGTAPGAPQLGATVPQPQLGA